MLQQAIQCPEIPSPRGLKTDTNDVKMGTRVHLSCINGNSLIGASELVCMSSGNWNAPLPICESKLFFLVLFLITNNRYYLPSF